MIIRILVIALVIGLFVVTLGFRKFREKHDEFVSMIVTLCATFVGVLLALSLNRIDVQDRENKQVIQLLESATDNVIHTTVRIRDYAMRIVDTSSTDSSASDFFMDNPLEEPGVFLALGNNELMLRNMHYEINEAVLSQGLFLSRIANRVSTVHQSNLQINNAVTFYLRILWYIRKILDLQLRYSEKEITECGLILGKQQLLDEYKNMDGPALKNAINNIIQEYDERNQRKLQVCNDRHKS